NYQLLMKNSAPSAPSAVKSKPTDLAYIIYTSGTTGKPKGTLTMHYNVIRVVRETNYINITPDDRILQLSNYAFDGSVFDIYGALLNGASLVMMKKEDVPDPLKLSALIKGEAITLFFNTTALFNTLVDHCIDCFDHVRNVLFGGEKVSFEHSERAFDYLGADRIIHVYGPTESTVYASYYNINRIDEVPGTIPIGKPLSNTTLYVLDKQLKP
ncbi:MAG: AMP-binding protein, partial [bacterium]|nr:AMP-binding protein [bacterium]